MTWMNLWFYAYLLNYDSGNWILLARQKECLVEKALICKPGGIL